MEPIFGFLLYFIAAVVVWVVARKRGRSGFGFFLLTLVLGFGLVMLIAAAGGGGMAAGLGAFAVPVLVLMAVLAMSTSEQAAVASGVHGDYRKCPFCAEPVRKEAIKCKHCGSELTPL